MPGTSNNGGEYGTWCIVSGKASFAHTRSVVNNEGGDFVFHFLRRQGVGRGGEREGGLINRDAQTVMPYIWQTSSGRERLVVIGARRWMSQWRRFQSRSGAEKQRQFSPSVLAMAIYGKSERSLEKAAARPEKPPHTSLKSTTPFQWDNHNETVPTEHRFTLRNLVLTLKEN